MIGEIIVRIQIYRKRQIFECPKMHIKYLPDSVYHSPYQFHYAYRQVRGAKYVSTLW